MSPKPPGLAKEVAVSADKMGDNAHVEHLSFPEWMVLCLFFI